MADVPHIAAGSKPSIPVGYLLLDVWHHTGRVPLARCLALARAYAWVAALERPAIGGSGMFVPACEPRHGVTACGSRSHATPPLHPFGAPSQGLQQSEGVLVMSRGAARHADGHAAMHGRGGAPGGSVSLTPPVAPPTDIALPTKNNQILSDTLQVMKDFREQVDRARGQPVAASPPPMHATCTELVSLPCPTYERGPR